MYGVFYMSENGWVQHGTDYVNRCDAVFEADIFEALTGRVAQVFIKVGGGYVE